MASTAKSFLMVLLILLAISLQALSNKSENVNVKQPEFSLKSDLIPVYGSEPVPSPHFSGTPPEKLPHPSIPSHTPYTSNDKYTPGGDHIVAPNFGFETLNQGRISSAARIPKPSDLIVPSNTPYTGIPPKRSPQNNIPSYTPPYAGSTPTKPPQPYTGIAPEESQQELSNKSKSENVDVKQPEFLLKSDLIPADGSEPVPPPHFSSTPPEKSPHPSIPSNTPYTSISPPKNSPDINVPSNTPYTGIHPKKSPQNNIPSYTPYAGSTPRQAPHPYTGIAPEKSPQNNIPSYTAYASIAPTTPHLSIPSYTSYPGSDRYIPKRPTRIGVPSKTPYAGIPPKTSPHNNIPSYTPYAGSTPRKPPHLTIPSYTPYVRGEDYAAEPDPGSVGSVPPAARP